VAYDLGNPKAFNVEPNQPDGKSSTVLVEALNSYETGNIAVMLKGQDTPVMLTLMPGQTAVDYRVDLRVPGVGPNAKPMAGGGLPAVSDPQLLTFLNGVPAEGATALQVVGGPGQAWRYKKHMYLRTTLTLLSPSWTATMSSPDGTHVYELQKAPVVLVSQQGKMSQLTIKGL
jgi:intracellular multiplication protein IcmK